MRGGLETKWDTSLEAASRTSSLGLTRTETEDVRRRTRTISNFCANCTKHKLRRDEYFVHELTSEASSRMKCVVKIMAMPGTRAAVAVLCMFGLAACDDGGPGFVNASVRICSIINDTAENKGLSLVEAEMGKLMHQDEQELLSVWEGWHWWLDPELCAKARREEVEYIRRHKMYVRVPREVCLRETGKAPIKTGWAETDKGQPGKPNVRARWVAKEYKTHARPELYASTPPLEALKVVLSEIAMGVRERYCVDCCDAACTAHVTPHKIGKRHWHRRSAVSG